MFLPDHRWDVCGERLEGPLDSKMKLFACLPFIMCRHFQNTWFSFVSICSE